MVGPRSFFDIFKINHNIKKFILGCFEGYVNLMCDPTNEADLNEHSLPVEIMKSTANETVIKLSKFISLCFEKRSKCLEPMNADSE